MANCKIEGCPKLTKGTTFLCDDHWKLVPKDRREDYQDARARFRTDPCDFHLIWRQQIEVLCLASILEVLEEDVA
jgi:hypothetical protein